MNHSIRRKARQFAASGILICAALAALALSTRAQAQFTGGASATAQFESDSNVFDLNSGVVPPGGTSASRRSDSFFAYGAAMDGIYAISRQQLYATASTTQAQYQHYTELNHTAYQFDAGLKWVIGDLLSGRMDVARTRTMVPFYDLSGSTVLALSLETEQIETFDAALKISPEWKMVGSAFTSQTDEPIPQAPNLQANQSGGTTAIEYLGFGPLTSGITAGYLYGNYDNANGTENPSYIETTAGALANYKLERTSFDGQIGYTRRVSDTGSDNTAGFTGLLDFKDQLTAKTSFNIKIERLINNYVFNQGSEIDSDAGAGVKWQATYKLAVAIDYTYSYREYPQQGNDPVGSDRIDHQQYVTLGLSYQPQRLAADQTVCQREHPELKFHRWRLQFEHIRSHRDGCRWR